MSFRAEGKHVHSMSSVRPIQGSLKRQWEEQRKPASPACALPQWWCSKRRASTIASGEKPGKTSKTPGIVRETTKVCTRLRTLLHVEENSFLLALKANLE